VFLKHFHLSLKPNSYSVILPRFESNGQAMHGLQAAAINVHR